MNRIDLAAAISILDATKTESGEYRYHDEGTASDWLVSASDLALLVSECDGDYSLWCAYTDAVEIGPGMADALGSLEEIADTVWDRVIGQQTREEFAILARDAGEPIADAWADALAHSAAL